MLNAIPPSLCKAMFTMQPLVFTYPDSYVESFATNDMYAYNINVAYRHFG